MNSKKIVYFGTPDFSSQILEALIKDPKINVVAVVTQPDKPQGRKNILTASAVAQLATQYKLPVFKPSKLDQSNLQHIKLLQPDLFLVAAYGQIIPPSWLDTPQEATLNIHFSLLPKYRGALCVSEAIKNQDTETGVTLMVMDQQLDHGPIITQLKTLITTQDNVATLTQKLTSLAISLIPNLVSLKADDKQATPQDHTQATFTPSLKTRTRQSAFIPSSKIYPPKQTNHLDKLHALIRSLNPNPGAWTNINGQEIKLIETKLEKNKLTITKVQLPGKNPISWSQFLTGHQIKQKPA
jgi:methionyl-tRNA formyltransferase